MRILLLLLSLLRLVPDATLVASGESHCARSAVAASGLAAAHHAHGSGKHAPGAPTHGPDCPHCPPADCGQQTSCSTATASAAMMNEAAGFAWLGDLTGTTHPESRFRSITHTPPTRPPAALLA